MARSGKINGRDVAFAPSGKSGLTDKLKNLNALKVVAGADASGGNVDVSVGDSMAVVDAVLAVVTATGYFPTATVQALVPVADYEIKASDDTKLTLKNTDYSAYTLLVHYRK